MNNIIKEDLKNIISSKLPWEKFRGKTVLVSGATGFLPAYMVQTLLYLNDTMYNGKDKIRVLALARNPEKVKKRFSEYLKRQDIYFLLQDVCEPIDVSEKVDIIIHAASQASPKYYGKDPVGTLLANVVGTKNLLELAVKSKAEKFLFFSSGEVYGEVSSEQIPIKETNFGYFNPAEVRSCYGESKRMGENMCVSWTHQFGINAVIVRPFHTYGPGMSLDDGRVFADFVADIVNNRNIVLKSDGNAIRAFCYLSDAVIGFFTVLLKGEKANAYNVGNEKCEISIYELAKSLVGLYPEKRLIVKRSIQAQNGYIVSKVQRPVPDTTKLRVLGWEPVIDIEKGFRRTIESYEDEQ